MKLHKYYFISVLLLSIVGCHSTVSEPKNSENKLLEIPNQETKLTTPTQRQLDWQMLEYYAFIHFNMNTFTDMEWGDGSEDPKLFNPESLDTDQWARTCKEAGMKGIIITAKHHDGFCLWPSKYTEHSVKNATWKNGQGDVLKDLAESCKKYDLKFGVYLSPWDRNHAEYGRETYVEYFHNQLKELLTQYGDIFEVWFDGANGGSGYYGGANETRNIDAKTYYQWDKVNKIIRELQPNAVIFGGVGQDIRWIGNEKGYAGETNWSTLNENNSEQISLKALNEGTKKGKYWVPGEVDVSIRPGWYYHKREDHQVHSLSKLVDIYYKSVGRNAALLLNLPVDARGLIHKNDVKQLMRLKKTIEDDFANDLSKKSVATADNENDKWNAQNTIDDAINTYWTTDDKRTSATLTYAFVKPISFNRVLIQEYIPFGQRVSQFTVEAKINNQWETVTQGTTIGYKRILRFNSVSTDSIRVKIQKSLASPMISKVGFYDAPNLLVTPEVQRSKDGIINLWIPEKTTQIYYTINGDNPDKNAILFTEGFELEKPSMLKSVTYDPKTDSYSEVNISYQDIAKKDWKVILVSSGNLENANTIIDNDTNTWWHSDKSGESQEVIIDLGKTYHLKGFTYMPAQDRWTFGTIKEYEFEVSNTENNWKKIASGEFGNIKNNPIEQRVYFDKQLARYIKFKSKKVVDDSQAISIGEIGVITESQIN